VNLAVQQFLDGPAFSSPERAQQRTTVERRSRERREYAGREVLVPVDRRLAERRAR